MVRIGEKQRAFARSAPPLAEALVARAEEMVGREGHEAISLRPLAASLGVSHVAALHHFETRDALLAAVAVRGFDALDRALAAAVAQERAARGFRRLGEAYVAWAMANPNVYRLMFASRLRGQAEVDDRANRLFSRVAAVVARGQAKGELRAAPPAKAAFFAWATAHGAVLLLLDERTKVEPLAACSAAELVAAALGGVGRAIRRPAQPRAARPTRKGA